MTLRPSHILPLALSLMAPAKNMQADQTTYCNPVDIDYRYNFEQKERGISFRSGADPVIVNHKGEYYMFVTISGGWWHSKDLIHWKFVKPDVSPHSWPKEDMCAPAATSAGGNLYLFQSTFEQRPIWVTTNPSSGRLEQFNPLLPMVPGASGPWDPAIFHDEETDAWFMYFGSSNIYPIYGVELDFSRQLTYKNTSFELIRLHPEKNGWERFGPNHTSSITPFIEGAWMTKHDGKYYLQYAGPGTEYNVYANGTYVGDSPKGPFTYAPNNPISYKPGGFMTGAGHGNTFQDNFGNFWNTGTPWWAINFDFERRIAMFPTAFDAEGLLHASTRFGDFPHRIPSEKVKDPAQLFTGWMLLSYKKPVTASSNLGVYAAANITDENPRSFWVAATNQPGEEVVVDLQASCTVNALQVNFADYQAGLYGTDDTVFTRFRIHSSLDGKTWKNIVDLSKETRDRANPYFELPTPVTARFIKYEHIHASAKHLAISDIRVFGTAPVPKPQTPLAFTVRRDGNDLRNAFIDWKEVPNAVGYNILWGIAPGKLYQTYQVFAGQRTTLELRALTIGQPYWFAIEAFNEAGVSEPSKTVSIPVQP